jgi:hypothetical protein
VFSKQEKICYFWQFFVDFGQKMAFFGFWWKHWRFLLSFVTDLRTMAEKVLIPIGFRFLKAVQLKGV